MSLAAFISPSFRRGFLRDRDTSHLVPVMEKLDEEVATLVACALVPSGATSSWSFSCIAEMWCSMCARRTSDESADTNHRVEYRRL